MHLSAAWPRCTYWSIWSTYPKSCFWKAECLLAGDYNINLLNYETHVDTEIFVNNLYSSSFLPLITTPTRFTTTTATLIGNIMSSAFNDDLISGILIADVSDHLPVFAILDNATIVDSNVNWLNKPKATRVINDANMKNLSD